jgi:TonB-linked SusC/RagA family outer membrane protein
MKTYLHYCKLPLNKSKSALKWGIMVSLAAATFSSAQAATSITNKANKEINAIDVTVTGKVTDETGAGIPGATVKIKDMARGVVTDANGNFKIDVTGNSPVLVFSSLGYISQEYPISNRATLSIQLVAETKSLNEVVVVGYGSLKEKEVSSTITHVAAKDLSTVGGNNALMSLQGKVAGLTISNTATADPNNGPSIQLRGVSSRSAGLGPLYVIDGIPGGNVDNLNQNDIASIDVLKGGAASAIYGTRGSNGVILITTKKGTSAEQANYTNYVSFDVPRQTLTSLSTADYLSHNLGTDYKDNTNWLDAVSRKYAFGQRHTLSVSGGNGRTNYYISGDYRNANGIDLRATKMEYGMRANIVHTPANNLYTFTFTIAPRNLHSNNSDRSWFAQALTLNPTQPILNPANPNLYYYTTAGLTSPFNPVEAAKTNLSGTDGKYLDWSGAIKLNILSNWNTQLTVSQSNNTFFDFNFSPSTNTQIIATNGGRSTASRNYSVGDTKNFEWITNYNVNYKKHLLKVLAGYSYSYFNNQGLSASNSQFPSDVFTYNNLGAGLYNLVAGQNNVGSSQSDSRLIAFFGRLNYSFNDEVFLSASLRHEGSSKFGENHKWGDFPAASIAWDLSQRPFLKKMKWIDNLKIRGDYGVTGNQDFGSYQSLDTYGGYGYYQYNGTYYQVYGPSQNTNYDLHWEKAINYNAGIDFSLFQHRLSGSINYYIRKNQDLLGSYNVPLPPNVQGTIFSNVGSMENSGIELQLTGTVIQKKGFRYEISFAGATLENKFVSFSNDTYQGQIFVDGAGLPSPGSPGNTERLQEGKRIGSFYMYKSAGVDEQGRLLVYNAAGNIIPGNTANANDRQFVGNGLPKFTASLGNTFNYKNFDLSVYFRGVFAYQIFNTNAFYIGTPATKGSNLLSTAYTDNKYSKLTNSVTLAVASDYFLEPGDFVKLDNLTFGYTWRINNKYIKSVRVYGTGRGLATFTKYKGEDPETTSVNGLYPGVTTSLSFYPQTRQYLGGVQVGF